MDAAKLITRICLLVGMDEDDNTPDGDRSIVLDFLNDAYQAIIMFSGLNTKALSVTLTTGGSNFNVRALPFPEDLLSFRTLRKGSYRMKQVSEDTIEHRLDGDGTDAAGDSVHEYTLVNGSLLRVYPELGQGTVLTGTYTASPPALMDEASSFPSLLPARFHWLALGQLACSLSYDFDGDPEESERLRLRAMEEIAELVSFVNESGGTPSPKMWGSR